MRPADLSLVVALVLAACGPPEPPRPPGGTGSGSGAETSDTSEVCVTCELTDCADDDTPPDDVGSESDCEDAAVDQGCEAYSFEDDC